jgi:hypothetical protein
MHLIIIPILFAIVALLGGYYILQSVFFHSIDHEAIKSRGVWEWLFLFSLMIYSAYEILGTPVRKWVKSTLGTRVIAKNNGYEEEITTITIKRPLHALGTKAAFNVRLLNAHLKIETSENIPALDGFIDDPHIEKYVEVIGEQATKNGSNIAYNDNNEAFHVNLLLFDSDENPIEIEPYIRSFFPYDHSGHQLSYQLKRIGDLKRVAKVVVISDIPLKSDLILDID